MTTVKSIRDTFIQYFSQKQHVHIPSYPLVPENDPSLLFTNSGMVQFKDFFTGKQNPPEIPRAVTCQKCLRAGGKHNDLENIGYTARHHTFFEMLGNFSFGDYFKEQAIEHASNLIVKTMEIPRSKLWITVYHDDDESFNLWQSIAEIPKERIIRIKTDDNFWQMGNTGPCGPCSEIFYDYGEHIQGGPPGSPDEDGDRFTEIWNLVFMQFEQFEDKSRIKLPKPSVDTGMGLERIASVLQGKHDNYDTNHLKSVMEFVADTLSLETHSSARASLKVIVDHARAASFMIADGILPSNEGRGYVLRRIMRRGMCHAHLLGSKNPIFASIAPLFIQENQDIYPELPSAQHTISSTLNREEERFSESLEQGMHRLNAALANLSSSEPLPGHIAFQLYDTFGFPLDMTVDVLRRQGRSVNIQEFKSSMDDQKNRARGAWKGSGDSSTSNAWYTIKEQTQTSHFVGYTQTQCSSSIIALVNEKLEVVNLLNPGEKGYVVTENTPFYSTSGGQEADHGTISQNNHTLFNVHNTTQPLSGLILHHGTAQQQISLSQHVLLHIDTHRRALLSQYHSATHLLHAALRHHLGSHVSQKGSLVSDTHLRFDFSHDNPLSNEDILAIEHFVNEQILENHTVSTTITSPEKAREAGALALFGEKYGEQVRMVSMGPKSIELCGGTHVPSSLHVGAFAITKELSVASGIRRIEALAGRHLVGLIRSQQSEISSLKNAFQKERQQLSAQNQNLSQRIASLEALSNYEKTLINGKNIITLPLHNIDPKHMKSIADTILEKHQDAAVIIASSQNERATLVVALSDSLTQTFSAVNIINLIAHNIGAQKGGGRPHMAQTGGKNPNGIPNSFNDFLKYFQDHPTGE